MAFSIMVLVTNLHGASQGFMQSQNTPRNKLLYQQHCKMPLQVKYFQTKPGHLINLHLQCYLARKWMAETYPFPSYIHLLL